MIQSFRNRGAEDIFNGRNTRVARQTCPQELWKAAARKLDLLDVAADLTDLRMPPGNRLEKLSGDRSDQHSIRINERYRICFTWAENGPMNIEIVDYH